MNVTKKGYLTKKKKIACDQTALDRQTGLEKKNQLLQQVSYVRT